MPTALIRALGGWSERYAVASGEDLDLAFSVWVNDLDIVFDSRVLVDHVGKVTASGLDDWRGLWLRNRQLFLDVWGGRGEVPQLDTCDPERFARNRETARGVVGWMSRFFNERDQRLPMVPDQLRQAGRRASWRSGPDRPGTSCRRSCRPGWRGPSAAASAASAACTSPAPRDPRSLSSSAAAATFSSRWTTDPVPGIGSIWGERARSHAIATCTGLTPCRAATACTASPSPGCCPPTGAHGMNAMPRSSQRASTSSELRSVGL